MALEAFDQVYSDDDDFIHQTQEGLPPFWESESSDNVGNESRPNTKKDDAYDYYGYREEYDEKLRRDRGGSSQSKPKLTEYSGKANKLNGKSHKEEKQRKDSNASGSSSYRV
jgi:hypothetical protein